MKEYTIYHIPGTKIGVTTRILQRMRNQGFTEWEILEEHTDIYEVSHRERELQIQYGYPVDKIPYWKTCQNGNKYTSEQAKYYGAMGGRSKRDTKQKKGTN